MKSVYLKNTLLLACMVLASFLVFLGASTITLRNHTIAERRAGLVANADAVEDLYNTFINFTPNNPDDAATVNLLVSIVTPPTGRMLVANSLGIVVGCSSAGDACLHLGEFLPLDLRLALLQNESISGILAVDGFWEDNYHVHARIIRSPEGLHGGYVLTASETRLLTQEWGFLMSVFLPVAMVVLSLAVLLAMIVARHQAAPLREMSAAATKFAHGDYSARVETRDRIDEIGELTRAFNSMADAIEHAEHLRRAFVGDVSHEFKTPMTSITGFAEGILDGTIPQERQGEYLQIIAAETKRLSRLIRRMLEVTQLQSMGFSELQKQSFDLTELLRRGVLALESKIREKGLDLSLTLPDDPLFVSGDADSILQVTYNLLDNAAKFSHTGTVIAIELTQKGGKAHIRIQNTGETIPAEDLPLLFNRFHKRDKSRNYDKDGVGLGLYIVKTILNAHREDIYARSSNGVTEFSFTLSLTKKKRSDLPAKGDSSHV